MSTSREMFNRDTGAVLRNLNREIRKIKGNLSKKGMYQAVLLVERTAKIKTPVDTGNLIGSYSTNVKEHQNKITGEIRNSAAYAVYVHEMPKTNHFKKPGSGPKFLEQALFENRDKIAQILARSVKLK